MSVKNLHSQLIGGLLGSASVKLIGALLGVIVVVALARVLGPSEFGVYSYVMALVSLLAIPVQSGLPTLVIRETARAQQARDWQHLKGLWRWAAITAAGFAALIGLVVLSSIGLLSLYLGEEHLRAVLWGLILVPLIAWSNLCGATLTGMRKVVIGQLSDNILRPGILLLLLLGGYSWQSNLHLIADEAMTLAAAAAALGLLTICVVFYVNRPFELVGQRAAYRTRAWFVSLWPLALVTGLQAINRHTDILMLGLFVPADQVGIYRVAVQCAGTVTFLLQIVNSVVAPQFVRLYAAGNCEQLQRVITRSAQLALLGAMPFALVLILAGGAVLHLVFGEGYRAGHTALAILAVGQLINAAMGSVGLLLNMTGHERETAKGVAMAAVLNIPLNLAFIPMMGMSGAALATAISLLVWNIVLSRAVRRRLGLNSTAFRFLNTSRQP